MPSSMSKAATIDEYLATQPSGTRDILQKLREVIHAEAPEAVEAISYGMPAFKQGGVLVYFAGYKSHIGFYPTAAGIEAFAHELASYDCSKGTIRFSLDKPIPYDLIRRIVRFRVKG